MTFARLLVSGNKELCDRLVLRAASGADKLWFVGIHLIRCHVQARASETIAFQHDSIASASERLLQQSESWLRSHRRSSR
jgi:hypothetical protein